MLTSSSSSNIYTTNNINSSSNNSREDNNARSRGPRGRRRRRRRRRPQPANGMAGSRGRSRRTRSWFLLKDSAILILVTLMCCCSLHRVAEAEVLRPGGNAVADALVNKVARAEKAPALASPGLSSEKLLPFSVISLKTNASSSGISSSSSSRNSGSSSGFSSGISSGFSSGSSGRDSSVESSSATNGANVSRHAGETSGKSDARHSKSNSHNNNNDYTKNNDTKDHNNNATSSAKTTTARVLRGGRVANADEHLIRENVMFPSSDPEREARLLYEQTLKAFHSSSSSNSNSDNDNNSSNQEHERTLHAVCEPWLQKHCQCTGRLDDLSLSCRGIGILAVPVELPADVTKLDLGNNNITTLDANSFFMVPNLEGLVLADNSLRSIDPNAFYGLGKLKKLSLQNCGLKAIPSGSFEGLTSLESLQLNGNALTSMDSASLRPLHKLRTLRLEGNLFYRIPTNALAGLKTLEALNLGTNLLTIINDEDFPQMPNLVVLLLKRNQIMKISPGAFTNLTALEVLELDDNLISSLPDGLNKLTHLEQFSAARNRLRWINDTDLPKNLQAINLQANPLSLIVPGALRGMPRLKQLTLSDVRVLKSFPDLDGCHALDTLKLDRAGLKEVPSTLCRQTPRLKSLGLKTNSLVRIPNLANCRELRLLDLSSNRLETLGGSPFLGLKQLNDLLLSYNRLKVIPKEAFLGISRLQRLDLEGNEITFIHKDAFVPFVQLEDLNLGNNIFPELPASGLHRLLHLKTFNNPKLRDFPAPDTFPRIQTLILSYAYHCCPFLPLVAMSATRKPPEVQETIIFPGPESDMSLWNNNNSKVDIWSQLPNLSQNQMNDILDTYGPEFKYQGNLPAYEEEDEYLEDYGLATGTATIASTSSSGGGGGGGGAFFRPIHVEDNALGSIQCLPMPGPFLPCADLFDWWTLRCGVWVVFLLALLGNGTVVFVLLFSRSKMDVPRFLVCNLAAADFFMGVYLGILAIVDASTLGEFRMFAIPWQMSVVCQVAGFLAVLSSELSVYTLAVITLERNYAITHAIHLNKRLSLRQAGYIMFVGWTFALVMAVLPLVGVSDYRKFAVCLPFETTTGVASLTYVIALMIINGCAFLTLMGCYLKMYWAIRGSQAWNTNDSRIAKRMALLVFTDFLCWSPIAFFSITAIFGLQLISLEQAKIFTVFILPLNSCCNPFLYAIMTKQFKKDCVMLCKAFEETRVARAGGGGGGIGGGGVAGMEHRRMVGGHVGHGGIGRGGERTAKDLPPLLAPAAHPPGCRCLRMMPSEMPTWHKAQAKEGSVWTRTWQRLAAVATCCYCRWAGGGGGRSGEGGGSGGAGGRQRRKRKTERRTRNARNANTDPYQYQFSEIKQKKQTRASSISSENFCSSRSSSWRNGPPSAGGGGGGPGGSGLHHHQHHHHHHGGGGVGGHHACAIPLKMMDRRRHSAWLITRKTSQDSNLSSSRNDSSASATTASTSTFRLSRSSAGSTTPLPSIIAHSSKAQQQHPFTAMAKPRLVRQEAVQEEEDSSPPRLGVRFLPTIPSAADSSIVMDDGDSSLGASAVLTPTHSSSSHFYDVLPHPSDVGAFAVGGGVSGGVGSAKTTQPTSGSSPKSLLHEHPP